MSISNQDEREFLFEKKHWKILLEKLKPSIRLLVKKYIIFNESVIVVGKEGEEQIHRRLTLDVSANDEGNHHLTQDDAGKISRALEKGLMATLLELEVLPKDATDDDGRLLYKRPEKEDCARAEEGFVYFIRNKDLFKIGITTDLKRRMDELKPSEILNCVRCKNYKEIEKKMHAHFKSRRIPQTEYFRLDASEIEEAHSLMIEMADLGNSWTSRTGPG